MGLRTEALEVQALAKEQYPEAFDDDAATIDVVARWTALDRLREQNHAGWMQLVHKHAPELPQYLAIAAEVDQGCPGPSSGLVLSQLLELAERTTWQEIEELENK